MLYILRGIKTDQTCHSADVGSKNILGIAKCCNPTVAKRCLVTDSHKEQARKAGYAAIALYDDDGVILKELI